MTSARVLIYAAGLVALLAAPVAQAQPVPGGKGVVVVQATRVPGAVARLVDDLLRERLQAAGSTPIAADAVTSMQAMLKLPRRRSAEDWIRLGRSLMADRVLVASLDQAAGKIRVELTLYTVATEVALGRAATVPAAELLATTGRLADDVLGATPAREPAPAPAPPAPAPPAPAPPAPAPPAPAPPAPAPAPPASQPTSAPAVVAPTPPAVAPRVGAAPAPAASAPAPAASAPAPAASAPAPAASAPAPVDGAPRGLSDPNRVRQMMTLGLRSYYLFEDERGGPMLDLELGILRNSYRVGALVRTYFGDTHAFLLGLRFEGGPRWGQFRLGLGGDFGFIVIPDSGDTLDLALFSARLVSGMYQWKHFALVVDAFNLDMYLVPADKSIGRDVQAMFGFNSGVSIAAYF